ncbi:MAG: GEVED domain-containing protein, partial [Planctomycetota bacterium]|nr:GEVED domain-containing protein [Planctomycetota bacterium]
VTLGSATLTVNQTSDTIYAGVVSGTGGLSKAGVGRLALSSNQTFTGATSVNGGTLVIDGSLDALSPVTVGSGATLSGAGTVPGSVAIRAGARLDGSLSIGQLGLDTATSVNVLLSGTAPGGGFNQTVITGAIDLDADSSGGAALNVSLGFTPSAVDSFVIIDNTGSAAVGGRFAGLPEGSTLLLNAVPLEVSYVGGDGNEVVLNFDTTPVVNAGSVDNIVVRLNADNLEVVDTDTSTVLLSAPAAAFASLTINGETGNDTITVQSLGSVFTGDLILNGGADNDQITFEGVTDFGGGSIELNAESIGFDAIVNATGLQVTASSVSQTASLGVGATATFSVGGNDLRLDHIANDFSTVVVTSAGNVWLDDANEISLGAATINGDLHVDTAGDVDVVGVVSIGGTLSIDTLANGGTGASVIDSGSGYLFAPSVVSINAGDGGVLVDHSSTWLGPSDFGDAGLPYPTTWADFGANHPVDAAFHLGAFVDADSDGQPSLAANGDDIDITDTLAVGDDEDGVWFLSTLVRADDADTRASLVVTAALGGREGFLNAWIDFNGDGNWNGAREQIVTGMPLNEGANLITIVVPQGADSVGGELAARFRLSEWQTVNPGGFAQTGEVEDYLVTVLDGSAGPLDLELQLPFAGDFELRMAGAEMVVQTSGSPSHDLLRLPLGLVNSMGIVGTDGDDRLVVDFTFGNPLALAGVTFDGRSQTTANGDAIQIDGPVGFAFDQVTYTAADFDSSPATFDGSIEFIEAATARQLNYLNLEPILDNSQAVDRVFTIDPAFSGDHGVRLVNDATVGISRIESTGNPAFETVSFASPSNSLTINAGGGHDTIALESLDPSFSGTVILNGDAGDDSFTVTPGGPFSVTVNGGLPNAATTVGDSLSFTQSGTIVVSDGTAGDGTISSTGVNDVTFTSIEDVVTADVREISLASAGITISETNAGTTTATLTLQLSQPHVQDVSVTVQTSDGTATAGNDFTAINQTLTIPAGSTSADLDVLILGDETVELDEQFSVTFSNQQSTGTEPQLVVAPLTATVTISNDDATVISLQSVPPVVEGSGSGSHQVLIVRLDRAIDIGFTVDFQTLSDTAMAGVDFTSTTGTLTFAGTAGEQQTVSITVLGDDVVELDEVLRIAFSNLIASGRAVDFELD